MCRQTIPPGPADLLVIAFDALGQIVVQNEAHIRLIDTHAEGDSGDDDLDIVTDKGLLVAAALDVLQAGMIRAGLVAVSLQVIGQFIHLLA